MKVQRERQLKGIKIACVLQNVYFNLTVDDVSHQIRIRVTCRKQTFSRSSQRKNKQEGRSQCSHRPVQKPAQQTHAHYH